MDLNGRFPDRIVSLACPYLPIQVLPPFFSPPPHCRDPMGNPEVSGYEEVDRDEKGTGGCCLINRSPHLKVRKILGVIPLFRPFLEGFVLLLNVVSRKRSPKGLWVKL